MSGNNKKLGDFGEEQSCRYLEANGYRLICRNYRSKAGEIDIIAAKDDSLVFIEVKTRRTTSYGMPAEAVDYKKQERYIKTALYFINSCKDRYSSYRFDIIELLIYHDKMEINHIKDAFRSRGTRYYL